MSNRIVTDDGRVIESNNSEIPISHSASQRLNKRIPKQTPDDFDDRAKANAQRTSEIHEFRRENIKEMEERTDDPFDYEPDDDMSRRYDALKIESLFRFSSTYKALKWGVMVGSMFAMHRYYRTRSINNAAHWFTVMSFVSFFNIWLSYGLQEFVTDYGTRKSVSMTARQEYQNNAYKHYVDRIENETKSIDHDVMPMLDNDTGAALDTFINNYQKNLREKYGCEGLSTEAIATEKNDYDMGKISDEEMNRIFAETQDPVTVSKKHRICVYKKDIISMQKAYLASSTSKVRSAADIVFERTSMLDLLEDLDATYSPKL